MRKMTELVPLKNWFSLKKTLNDFYHQIIIFIVLTIAGCCIAIPFYGAQSTVDKSWYWFYLMSFVWGLWKTNCKVSDKRTFKNRLIQFICSDFKCCLWIYFQIQTLVKYSVICHCCGYSYSPVKFFMAFSIS